MVTVSLIAGSPSTPVRGEIVPTPLVALQPGSVRGMSNAMGSLAVDDGSPAAQLLVIGPFVFAAVMAPSSVHLSVRVGSLEVVSTVMVSAWAGLVVASTP